MTQAPATLEAVAEPMLPREYRVLDVHRETADTATITFEPTGTADAVGYRPGQFTMIYSFAVGEVPISVAGGDVSSGTLVHTVRAVGAVTAAICRLQAGDRVGIRGPYGVGWPVDEAEGKDVIVIAGGIGLAPLRPVVLHLLAKRDRYGAVNVIYGARSPADLLYESELRQWRSRFDMEVEVTVDRGDEDWFGDVGLVTNLLPRIEYDPQNVVAMVCGPEIMMKVVARALGRLGVSSGDVYLSIERNMKCAIGFCGHCQYREDFVCRDGPVFKHESVRDRLRVSES